MNLLLPELAEIVQRALREDIGHGDVTSLLTVLESAQARAEMVVKTEGVVAGLPVAAEVFSQVDPRLQLTFHKQDGDSVTSGEVLCEIAGSARSILTAERVALNFVQRLSGIATKTARMVALVKGTNARIVDTRKTTPGLRALEKYAVRMGGGFNHRFGLYDAVMIKDNHIQAAGGILPAVKRAYALAPHTTTVTVECDTLEQVNEALAAGVDIILLDNMSLEQLREAVERIGDQAAIEVSGGITEVTVAEIAAIGVNVLSVGALTHSAPALDVSLNLFLEGG
jgi:nicotinate-nucleotide pyrophosphorylase (carboxylating)